MAGTSPLRVIWTEGNDTWPDAFPLHEVIIPTPRVAAPSDDDTISFAPPPPLDEDGLSPLERVPRRRPGLPRQTLDVRTAQMVTRGAILTPPGHQSLRASIAPPPPVTTSPDPQPLRESVTPVPSLTSDASEESELVGAQGSEHDSESDSESYWRSLQLLICFWKRRSRGRSSTTVSNRSSSVWRKFRANFSRKPPPGPPSPRNSTRLATTERTGEGDDTERRGRARHQGSRGGINRPGNQDNSQCNNPITNIGAIGERSQSSNKESSGATDEEVQTHGVGLLLERHRNRVSEGHHGRLRARPDPNNPNTPIKPMPRLHKVWHRQFPPPGFGSPSYTSTGAWPPSSRSDYLSNHPSGLYASNYHNENSASYRPFSRPLETDDDGICLEDSDDHLPSPQNSSITNTATDSRRAQIKRSDDVSHLLSEVRYPSQSPLALDGISDTRETGRAGQSRRSNNRSTPMQSTSIVMEAVTERLTAHTLNESRPVKPLQQNQGSEGATSRAKQAVSGSRRESHWPASYVRVVRAFGTPSQQHLKHFNESGGGTNGKGNGVATSSVCEEKSVDREAHPNHSSYVGYKLVGKNTPPGDPGPSNWHETRQMDNIREELRDEDGELD